MHRIIASVFTLATAFILLDLAGCDNRTQEGVRWDQIAQDQRKDAHDQSWEEAKSPWRNDRYHEGKAW
jgi:hypothetical protein